MSFKSGVTTRVDNAQAILDALKSLTKKDVLVGIPAEDSDRDDVSFGNAGIGYINEYGSPAQNIPPRPHLVPGVKSVEDQTMPQLKAAAQAALDGNVAGAERALNRAGTVAARGVKNHIKAANFTPLADSTVEARARRGRKGAKAELARRAAGESPGTTLAKPLYDTGKYLASITHVVRDKDADS
ncbi:hypothetical protein DL122_16620 [Salmonella enterica subsp. salamae]|nr:hypothetical protein [Salmonella enterica subsp. salamae]ECG0707269.1 hypothetical protein [Salmonella enterica subsp. salamae]EDW2526169.1 hypothetical protein [Salmonella enterica subsp. salamae]